MEKSALTRRVNPSRRLKRKSRVWGGTVEKSSKETDTFAKSWTEFKSQLDLAIGTIKTIGEVAKQAFDLGKEGAQLKDTQQSLERLALAAGVSADLLGQLEKAAGGTVDDLDLAGSTIRLLTGETGDFATALANAAPQLVTIARAAVKLNPTLGDTASAYEAITRAIETGNVRALKNYGIILEDVENKQDALNQILEQGGVLIGQVGGNVETAVDDYSRLEIAIDDLRDAFALLINETGVIQHISEQGQAWAGLVTAVADGTLTYEEAVFMFNKWILTGETATDLLEELDVLSGEAAQASAGLATETEELTTATTEWGDSTFYAKGGAQDLMIAQEQLKQEIQSVKAAFDDLKLAMSGPIGKEYDSFIQKNDDLMATAEELREKMQELGATEFITPEQVAAIEPLQNELTGVNMKINEVSEALEKGLGEKKELAATANLEELRLKAWELEQGIRDLGGVPYMTDEQQADLEDLRGEYDEVTAKIEENKLAHMAATQQIIFDIASQQIAMSGLDPSEQLTAITALAEAWGLVDEGTVAAMTASEEALAAFLETGDMDTYIEKLGEIRDTAAAAGDESIIIPVETPGADDSKTSIENLTNAALAAAGNYALLFETEGVTDANTNLENIALNALAASGNYALLFEANGLDDLETAVDELPEAVDKIPLSLDDIPGAVEDAGASASALEPLSSGLGIVASQANKAAAALKKLQAIMDNTDTSNASDYIAESPPPLGAGLDYIAQAIPPVIAGLKALNDVAGRGGRDVKGGGMGDIGLPSLPGLHDPSSGGLANLEELFETIIEGAKAAAAETEDLTDDILGVSDALFDAAKAFGGLANKAADLFEKQTLDPLKAQLEGLDTSLEDKLAQLSKAAGIDIASVEDLQRLLPDLANLGLGSEESQLANEILNSYAARAELAQEIAAQEERILKLQEQQQKIDFLSQQFELIKFLQEQGINPADVLGGLDLGPDADPAALIDAMSEALEKLLEKLGAELTGLGFQHGANFVVPPGYPGDSFGPMWATSGEHVSVTPNQGAMGGGANITINMAGAIIMSQQEANRMMKSALDSAGAQADIYRRGF